MEVRLSRSGFQEKALNHYKLLETMNAKIEVLSSAQGVKPSVFVNQLLKEDIDRLWKKFRQTG
jgi:hypothetical protein